MAKHKETTLTTILTDALTSNSAFPYHYFEETISPVINPIIEHHQTINSFTLQESRDLKRTIPTDSNQEHKPSTYGDLFTSLFKDYFSEKKLIKEMSRKNPFAEKLENYWKYGVAINVALLSIACLLPSIMTLLPFAIVSLTHLSLFSCYDIATSRPYDDNVANLNSPQTILSTLFQQFTERLIESIYKIEALEDFLKTKEIFYDFYQFTKANYHYATIPNLEKNNKTATDSIKKNPIMMLLNFCYSREQYDAMTIQNTIARIRWPENTSPAQKELTDKAYRNSNKTPPVEDTHVALKDKVALHNTPSTLNLQEPSANEIFKGECTHNQHLG